MLAACIMQAKQASQLSPCIQLSLELFPSHAAHCPAATHLLAFKTTLYDPLESMSNWQQGSNPCGPQPWNGLVCDDGWVVAIRLQEKALLGQLAPDLLQVSHLVELHLANNLLTGMYRAQSCQPLLKSAFQKC